MNKKNHCLLFLTDRQTDTDADTHTNTYNTRAHTHTQLAVVFQPSPSPAGAGMCSNMLFTYPSQKTWGFHIGQEVRPTQQKPQRNVNNCGARVPTDYPTLTVVYTHLREINWDPSSLTLTAVYTPSRNKLWDIIFLALMFIDCVFLMPLCHAAFTHKFHTNLALLATFMQEGLHS